MPVRPILLIEDNADDAALIQRALARSRLANPLVWMEDGRKALAWLGQAQAAGRDALPQFVLLDVKLPGLSGHEVLAEIRLREPLSLLPVVMLTSSNEERDRLLGYRNGANAYVVKPVDFSELQRVVEALGQFWAIVNQPPPM
jgi:two-component system, response regulator